MKPGDRVRHVVPPRLVKAVERYPFLPPRGEVVEVGLKPRTDATGHLLDEDVEHIRVRWDGCEPPARVPVTRVELETP